MATKPFSPLPQLPTPQEMIAHLNRFVHGQERAKRDLCVAVYNHFLGSRYAEQPEAQFGDFERQHILLLGPTGSGKTYMVRCLADYLGVPLSTASATVFSEVGYVGDHVDSLVSNLLMLTNGDVAQAQRGIIFLDEVDKIRRSRGVDRDVSGEGVQAALLTLLDGRETTAKWSDKKIVLDASKILFVCTGAFVGLDKIIEHRIQKSSGLGFASLLKPRPPSKEDDPVAAVETADLVEFGMIPEFIGRFSAITPVHPLTREDLISILTDAEGSTITKQQVFCRLHGIELEFEQAALEAIADQAVALGTGARGLRRSVLRTLDPIDYRLPELATEGITRIVVTADSVNHGAEPKLVRGVPQETESPAMELRRSALLPNPAAAKYDPPKPTAPTITNTAGWSDDQIRERLEQVKKNDLDWDNTQGSARKWWTAFENENAHRMALVLRLAEELRARKANITQFFLAYVYSNTDNIQANLHYFDYWQLKKRDEDAKKQKQPPAPPDTPPPVS